MTQAFLPLLTRSRGAIVNVLSVLAFAALPVLPAYSISKAAAFSLSQSLRALLKKSRFPEEQIVTAIKEHESGTPTQELCRRIGIGQQTLYRWRAKYGGMSVPMRSGSRPWRMKIGG